MVEKLFARGKKFLTSPQTSVLSAATIIMFMVLASRVLGLVRQRALAHFFAPEELSLFFAAFRLPDLIFEVLVFGTFSSAFIPVFTKALKKGDSHAWKLASVVTNIGIIIFLALSVVMILFSKSFYEMLAPGFGPSEQETIVSLTRILFLAQGFFVISYVQTAVLESSRRFLIPAIAPLFYNLGIILGTIFLSKEFGLFGPTIGVAIGSLSHLLIQTPLSYKLGFRFSLNLNIDEDVKKIGKLALPRILEVSFLQIAKTVELFLASIISTASYTYFTLANTIQLLPVGLFGTSIAKAALPTLSRQSDDMVEFRKTLFRALYQVAFLVLPLSTFLLVLRIPVVRLLFGTDIFTWEATVQTGMAVSAFAIGAIFQTTSAILARSFYALHDTKTPLSISLISTSTNIISAIILVRTFNVPTWGIALAFTLGSAVQSVLLFVLLERKIGNGIGPKVFIPFVKSILASVGAGVFMFFFLKFFDRSVWIKRLSFFGTIDSGVQALPFEKFVLDTRYTTNLFILTVLVTLLGVAIYIGISVLLKSRELTDFIDLAKKFFVSRKVASIPLKEEGLVTPPSKEI